MLIIIDANCSADALAPVPKPDFAPVMRAILDGKKKLAVGGSKQKMEYMRVERRGDIFSFWTKQVKRFL